MSKDLVTHLQAWYHSGQITGYIHSKLPEGPLKTGWIEQGLLSKGMKGNLRDKHNQESLVIPADRFARLTRDRPDWEDVAIVMIGPKGLVADKFVSILYGNRGSQSMIAFQIEKTSPHEITRFLLQNTLGKGMSQSFEEPNLDYIEQIRMDSSKGDVEEMIVLTLPKKQVKLSDWMKEALLSPSSEIIEVQFESSNKISKFAALITRWLTGLELFKNIPSGIAAIAFLSKNTIEACLWDQPQRKAVFSIFKDNRLEAFSSNYLTPLWLVPGESVETPKHVREVTVEDRTSSTRIENQAKPESSVTTISKSTQDAKTQLSVILKRLDSIESRIKSSAASSDISLKDSGTMDVLQNRLAESIERIESLSKRLVELEKRLRKIPS
ncbi:MAG: hypothetical protein ACFFFK_01290 [Candidatus Thorarchaeota archaeon]